MSEIKDNTPTDLVVKSVKTPAPGKAKGKKNAWEPPAEVRDALGDIVSILFRLQKGERKWVMKELTEALGSPAVQKTTKTTTAKPAKSAKPTVQKTKSAWKVKWESSSEWKDWQESIKEKPTPAETDVYEAKRKSCFLLRDKLRKAP